jgi:hypothetical protein
MSDLTGTALGAHSGNGILYVLDDQQLRTFEVTARKKSDDATEVNGS